MIRATDERAVSLALYPHATRRVRSLPQPPAEQLGTRIRLAAVQPLSFPPGDRPAPIVPDCAWCQRRAAVRDGLCGVCLDDRAGQASDLATRNGPVTVLAAPAHDQPKESFDGRNTD